MPTAPSGHGQKLSRKQEHMIAALLDCDSIAAAAAQAGIAEGTVYRWLKDTAFEEAYRKARGQVVRHSIVKLQRATGRAVETLVAVMEDEDSTASARVSAAKAVLEMAIKGVELDDLEARITALEAQARPK